MKLTCDEATTICDKNQYREASLWEKIKLGVHLFLCKKCGLYSKQNELMTTCYEIHKDGESNKKHCLDKNEKAHLEKELKARL